MANGMLTVQGTQVVDSNGKQVILRGTALGGWLKYVLPTWQDVH